MVRIFKHYMPKALLYLGVVEVLILLFAIYIAVFLQVSSDAAAVSGAPPVLPNALVFVPIMLFIMTALGLYERDLKEGEWGYFPRLGVSLVAGLVVMSAIFHIVPSLSLGRGVVATAFLFAVVGLTAARYSYIKLSANKAIRRRVLVLGSGSRAQAIGNLEQALRDGAGFTVVGYVPVAPTDIRTGAKIVNDDAPLSAVAKKHRIEEIVVAVRDRRGVLPAQELLACRLAGVRVVELPEFFERETGRIQLQILSTSWLIYSDGFAQGHIKHFTKRAFDMAASVGLLVLVWPLMLIAGALIRWEDRGPVFYRQERVGQNGKVFTLTKFRSMRTDAESDGKAQWAKKDDDRVTRIGRIMRKTRIDELPQLFNVLRGEMSFVGPRPERPQFVSDLARQIPYYGCRHTVKPGITGWAQVRYPYGASVEDAIEKLQYDLYYVKNNTIFLDLIILFQTVRVVIWNSGAR